MPPSPLISIRISRGKGQRIPCWGQRLQTSQHRQMVSNKNMMLTCTCTLTTGFQTFCCFNNAKDSPKVTKPLNDGARIHSYNFPFYISYTLHCIRCRPVHLPASEEESRGTGKGRRGFRNMVCRDLAKEALWGKRSLTCRFG